MPKVYKPTTKGLLTVILANSIQQTIVLRNIEQLLRVIERRKHEQLAQDALKDIKSWRGAADGAKARRPGYRRGK